MSKIRVLEAAEILLASGYIVIKIQEDTDGHWNIDISDNEHHRVRIAKKVPGGKHFVFMREIFPIPDKE